MPILRLIPIPILIPVLGLIPILIPVLGLILIPDQTPTV
jgi:hypothetical protein